MSRSRIRLTPLYAGRSDLRGVRLKSTGFLECGMQLCLLLRIQPTTVSSQLSHQQVGPSVRKGIGARSASLKICAIPKGTRSCSPVYLQVLLLVKTLVVLRGVEPSTEVAFVFQARANLRRAQRILACLASCICTGNRVGRVQRQYNMYTVYDIFSWLYENDIHLLIHLISL